MLLTNSRIAVASTRQLVQETRSYWKGLDVRNAVRRLWVKAQQPSSFFAWSTLDLTEVKTIRHDQEGCLMSHLLLSTRQLFSCVY